MSVESVMPSNYVILCLPLLLLPLISPIIRVFSNESVLHIRWPKYWSFSFSISPSNEYSGLIWFRIDWLDLLAVQGNLQESSPTPQFKSINSQCSAFFMAQLQACRCKFDQIESSYRWRSEESFLTVSVVWDTAEGSYLHLKRVLHQNPVWFLTPIL